MAEDVWYLDVVAEPRPLFVRRTLGKFLLILPSLGVIHALCNH